MSGLIRKYDKIKRREKKAGRTRETRRPAGVNLVSRVRERRNLSLGDDDGHLRINNVVRTIIRSRSKRCGMGTAAGTARQQVLLEEGDEKKGEQSVLRAERGVTAQDSNF